MPPYLVLARKYRPNRFAELIGQEAMVTTLTHAMAQGRVHHAYLLAGPRGLGKTTTARLLARALNCAEGARIEPCGRCAPCEQIAAQSAADVLEIDGASHTGVDSIRELRETVRYLPSMCRTKIYILDEVHMLSQAAFNALLKTLEEPPPHVKFVFATTEAQKVPATILSRCQRFDFRRVGVQPLVAHLQDIVAREGLQVSLPLLQAVARAAQGSVRDALSLLDQALSLAGPDIPDAEVLEALGMLDPDNVRRLGEAILRRDAGAALAEVARIDDRGLPLAQVGVALAEHLRNLAICRAGAPLPPELDASARAALTAQAGAVDGEHLQQLFRHALAVAEDVGRSPIGRTSLEMGLLRLMALPTGVETTTLIARLDALLAGGPAPAPGGTPPPPAALAPAPASALSPGAPARTGVALAVPSGDLRGASGADEAPSARTPGGETSPLSASPHSSYPAPAPASHGGLPSASEATFRDPSVGPDPDLASASGSTSPAGEPAPNGSPKGGADVAKPTSPPVDVSSPSYAEAKAPPGGPRPAPLAQMDSSPTGAPARPPTATVAPAPAPASEAAAQAMLASWQGFVDVVRDAQPALASVLEHARVKEFGPAGVILSYPRRSFFWETLSEAAGRAQVEAYLAAHLGAAVRLQLSARDEACEGALSLADRHQAEMRTRAMDLDEEARSHPLVHQAIDLLGAQVLAVRPAGG